MGFRLACTEYDSDLLLMERPSSCLFGLLLVCAFMRCPGVTTLTKQWVWSLRRFPPGQVLMLIIYSFLKLHSTLRINGSIRDSCHAGHQPNRDGDGGCSACTEAFLRGLPAAPEGKGVQLQVLFYDEAHAVSGEISSALYKRVLPTRPRSYMRVRFSRCALPAYCDRIVHLVPSLAVAGFVVHVRVVPCLETKQAMAPWRDVAG